nr:hypothetical protein [Tanacetum cinerariifolium]
MSWKPMECVRKCWKARKVMEALRSSRSLPEECRIVHKTQCRTEDPCRDKSVTSGIRASRFEAMANETEKNAASGSVAVDENRGRDDARQHPKKRGLDSNFTSIREDFRVAFNTLSGDIKHEIHYLRDLFMGEITKIREEFGEEVFTLHQTIEDFQADVALCKRSLASGGGNTNYGPQLDVPKPSPFVGKREARADTATLWWRRRYGDIERGTATIDTWADFVTDFKKQFYPENDKNEAKSRLRKLKHSETIREYIKEFTTLAKTELERRGVQDLATAIAHVEALIDFSMRREPSKPKDRKKASLNRMSAHEDEDKSDDESMGSMRILNVIKAKTEVPKVVGKGLQYVEATINGVKVRSLVDSGATHNFVAVDKAKRLGIDATKGSGILKATCMVSTEWDAKSGSKTLSAMQFKKGFNKSEPCYLVVTRLETDEGSSKVEVPKVIERVLDEFKDVMPKELPKKLPPGRDVNHTIELESGFKPPTKASYRMPPLELEEKKDGSMRMCIDYQALNKVTIKNKYHIPLIVDLFDQLGKARYFTKLDLRSGYYLVRIAEGDEAKMTCATRYGSYEFVVMPFGLTNDPAMFCTLMNKLFHPFLDKFVVVYLDDIVVYSHTLEEHVLHLKQAFQVLRDNKLCVKLEKCSFAQDEVEFLGHKIKDRGLMMDGAKIKVIQDWEPPTKVIELRSFLGLMNYYRRFIMGYSAIASPLTDLLKKDQAWIWDDECQAAFESLKKAVIEESVLRLPDVTMPFELHTNASDFDIGGVLMQDEYPIAFESRKLNETERKYTVQEKEMTAVVHCLRIWRHYLLGLRFVIKTDNIATSYFQTQKKLSIKQARWQDFLTEFDYTLEYKPGKANVVADALNRKAKFAAITQAQFFLQHRIKEGL